MADIYVLGAEWGDPAADGLTNPAPSSGALTCDSGNARTGTYAYKAAQSSSTAPFAKMPFSGALNIDYYWRGYFKFDANPNTNIREIMEFAESSADGLMMGVALQTDGTAIVIDTNGLQAGSASATLSTGTYHRLDVHFKASSGGTNSGTVEASVDGTTFVSIVGSFSTGSGTPGSNWFGMGVTTGTNVWWDDIRLASGGTFLGDGAVVLLRPTSDNANGTGWSKNGASNTTNLFSSVDNQPPVGVADASSGTTTAGNQIRNATAAANSNYDANLATYSSAGIAAGDTVNTVVPIVVTGAPVSTQAKQGTVGIVSNPAITNVSLGAGGTSGAFWAGSAAGTFPSGWKVSFGTATSAPSVTVGTSPVMRVTQVTSSTRIADVCAMGLYVDYTPAVAAGARPPSVITRQSVNRAASW